MTIHRAKGLEFPVVCVADLGRRGAGVRPPLLVGRDRTAGLRLSPLGGGETVPTAAWERLAEAEALADAEEERRLFYVALTRARDLLILSGGTDIEKWPEPRPGGAPIDWIVRAVADDVSQPAGVLERWWDGRVARVTWGLNTPDTLPPAALKGRAPARAAASTALPAVPAAVPQRPARARPAPQRLSYTQLSDYARCGYRFYLERVLRLPRVKPPPQVEGEEHEGISPLVRGSIVHRALEELDFTAPRPPSAETVRRLAAEAEATLTDDEVATVQAFVSAFADSPLCARLAQAPKLTREAAFSFALEPDGAGPLVSGFVDVLAREADGAALVIDYKTDHVPETDTPASLIERAYETQRLIYALAALRDGAPSVEVAHCLLERPAEAVTVTYTAEQAPDLTARIAELARGVLAHEHPVTPNPHRDLCGDCPGRTALCSHPEALTLRPPPAPWPGAPDRRSSAAGAVSAAGPPPR
jgi:ATP-dependent exoDNAse (exonuclease V) beta subunit